MEQNDILNNQFSLYYYFIEKNINADIIDFVKENGLDINYIGFAFSSNSIVTTNIKRRHDNGYRLITIKQEETENKILDNRKYSINSFIQIRVQYNNTVIEISKQYDSIDLLKSHLITPFSYYNNLKPTFKQILNAVKYRDHNKRFYSNNYSIPSRNLDIRESIWCFTSFIHNNIHYLFSDKGKGSYHNVKTRIGTLIIISNNVEYIRKVPWINIHKYFTERNIDYYVAFNNDWYSSVKSQYHTIYYPCIKYDKDHYINNFRKLKDIGSPHILSIFNYINIVSFDYISDISKAGYRLTIKVLPFTKTLILPADFNGNLDLRDKKIRCLICGKYFNKELLLPDTLLYLKVHGNFNTFSNIPNLKIEYW